MLGHLSPAALFPQFSSYSIMVWLGAGAVLACLALVPSRPSQWRSPEVFLMLGLTAAVPLSLIANGLASGALRGLREFLAAGIVFFLVLAAVDTVQKLRLLSLAVVLAAIFLLSQSLMGWYHNGLDSRYVYRQRITDAHGIVTGEFGRVHSVGILDDPNCFAQFLLVAVCLTMPAWSAGRHWRNLAVVILPGAFLLSGVMLTHSRGGLVGVAIWLFFLLEKRFGKIIPLVLAAVSLWLLFLVGAQGPRATSLEDPSIIGRIQVAQKGTDLLRSSPLFGIGFQRFTVYNPSLTVHNSLLLCLSELGIFGALLWCGVIVFLLVRLYPIVRKGKVRGMAHDLVSSASSVEIALYMFVGTAMFIPRAYAMTLYVLLGMAAAVRQLSIREAQAASSRTAPQREVGRSAAVIQGSGN